MTERITGKDTAPAAVFVMGNGHSGSTLLEMLLIDGPSTVGLGELGQTLAGVLRSGPSAYLTGRRCLCGAMADDCGFWSGLGPRLDDLSASGSLDLGSAYAEVIAVLGELHPGTTLVESSKNPQYLDALDAAVSGRVEVVHLVRDVRAWTVSSRRKAARQPQRGFVRRATRRWHYTHLARFSRWAQGNRAAERALHGRIGGHTRASYEGLATIGVEYVMDLRRAIGLAEPEVDRPTTSISHALHGNRARLSLRAGASVTYSVGWLYESGWTLASLLRPDTMRLNRRWVRDALAHPVRVDSPD